MVIFVLLMSFPFSETYNSGKFSMIFWLQAESLAASAKALAYQNVQYAFRLGQRVRHKVFGENLLHD